MADIRHTLLIGAPPALIYEALTTSRGLSSWWTPGAHAVPESGTVATFPFENGYVKHMEIKELKPDEFVNWQCVRGDREWISTSITFTLVERNNLALLTKHPEISGQVKQSQSVNNTVVQFQHNGWEAYTPSFAECSYTWAIFLRSLKLYCETGAGKPFPGQHRIA